MRHLLPLLLTLLLATAHSAAQDVKLKKGKVLIDGVETFDYTVDMLTSETHVCHLGTQDDIVLITYKNNGTSNYKGDDYMTVFFESARLLLSTSNMYYGLRGEVMVKRLITEKVLLGDGTIDPDRLETFRVKYGQ